MSKAADIYWDSRSTKNTRRITRRRTTKAQPTPRRIVPWWAQCSIAVSIFVMLAVAINFRAFTEVRDEVKQNAQLASQVENLMDENLALQDEIHSLKTDPTRIATEAKRIGIAFSTQHSAVSGQKAN